jgi:hypothetical protein
MAHHIHICVARRHTVVESRGAGYVVPLDVERACTTTSESDAALPARGSRGGAATRRGRPRHTRRSWAHGATAHAPSIALTMPYPAPQPIAHLAWRQTPARARRVAQTLCLRHGDSIDADGVARTLDVPAELVRVYLAAARAERALRNVTPGERMSSTVIAHAISTSSSDDGSVSSATVRRYLADPSGVSNRESEQRSRRAKRPRETTLKWPDTLVLERILEWHALYGTWPNGYDWTRAHAVNRGGEHLARWRTGHWPDAQTVRRLYYTFPLAAAAARRHLRARRLPTTTNRRDHDGRSQHDQV